MSQSYSKIVQMAECVHCGIDQSFFLPQRFFLRGESESRRVTCCLNRSSVRNEQPVIAEVRTRVPILYSWQQAIRISQLVIKLVNAIKLNLNKRIALTKSWKICHQLRFYCVNQIWRLDGVIEKYLSKIYIW
jgi:hypothetical protein